MFWGVSDLEFRHAVAEGARGRGASPHSLQGLILREGRENLLEWDHVTTVIEGFVSLCCLGNRNINQDAVCGGLELGAFGGRGGLWAGTSRAGAEGQAGLGGGTGWAGDPVAWLCPSSWQGCLGLAPGRGSDFSFFGFGYGRGLWSCLGPGARGL